LAIDAKKYGNVHVGLQKWSQYMSDFGLGHPIGIDLPHENSGNIPDSAYFNRVYKGNWNSCNMSIIGMGQGEVELTPIQLANAMCIIANRGSYYIPHFVKSIDGDTLNAALSKFREKKIVARIADSSFEYVIAGMQAVVDQGTGKIARIPDVAVCAKTGTVQNERMINGKKVKLQNHSMFVAFAPRHNPKIAVAVCIENAGYGATWAGPIASLMIEQYLNDTISPKRQALLKKMKSAKIIPNYTYILDSLDKVLDREREAKKRMTKENAKLEQLREDSLQRKKDSMTGALLYQQFYLKEN
jgi:penicillin-binding protein 2